MYVFNLVEFMMTPWRTNKLKLGRAVCLFENMPDLNLDPDLDQSWIRIWIKFGSGRKEIIWYPEHRLAVSRFPGIDYPAPVSSPTMSSIL
jgi:hypothetical protein